VVEVAGVVNGAPDQFRRGPAEGTEERIVLEAEGTGIREKEADTEPLRPSGCMRLNRYLFIFSPSSLLYITYM